MMARMTSIWLRHVLWVILNANPANDEEEANPQTMQERDDESKAKSSAGDIAQVEKTVAATNGRENTSSSFNLDFSPENSFSRTPPASFTTIEKGAARVRVDDKAMINSRSDVNQLVPIKYNWALAEVFRGLC